MQNKQFGEYKNIVITGATKTKDGRHLTTLPYDLKVADLFEAIAKEIRTEIGEGRTAGKMLIRERTESSILTSRSKAPFFVEHVPASEVQAYEAKNPRKPQSGI